MQGVFHQMKIHIIAFWKISDGYATSSKYDNDVIKFKRPNTVLVFSNNMPDWKEIIYG